MKTGSMLISLVVSLHVQPAESRNLYMGLDLSVLFTFGRMLRMIHEESSAMWVDLASFDEGLTLVVFPIIKSWRFFLRES